MMVVYIGSFLYGAVSTWGILNFVKWFYDGSCGYAGRNDIVQTLHHRRKRINEIKIEVQAHVHSKNRDFTVLDLNEFFFMTVQNFGCQCQLI